VQTVHWYFNFKFLLNFLNNYLTEVIIEICGMIPTVQTFVRNTLDLYIWWIVKYIYSKTKLTTIKIKQIISLGYFNYANFFKFLYL